MDGRIQNMDPRSPSRGSSPWTSIWTLSMDYPRGPPLIFEDEFVPEAGVNEF